MADMRITVAVAAAVLAAGAVALAVLGGGSDSHPATANPPTPEYSATTPRAALPSTTADAADERVIRRWARAVRAGEPAAAAQLFALPAVTQVAPGRPIVELRTRGQARAFNARLACGVTLLGTEPNRGQGEPGLTVAIFRLADRDGASCRAAGRTTRIGFMVADGRITHWLRLAGTAA